MPTIYHDSVIDILLAKSRTVPSSYELVVGMLVHESNHLLGDGYDKDKAVHLVLGRTTDLAPEAMASIAEAARVATGARNLEEPCVLELDVARHVHNWHTSRRLMARLKAEVVVRRLAETISSRSLMQHRLRGDLIRLSVELGAPAWSRCGWMNRQWTEQMGL